MLEKERLPAAGIFLGSLFEPELEPGADETGEMRIDDAAVDDPMTASDALRETLEGQGKSTEGL